MTVHETRDFSTPETVQVWQCIGCGRLEAPANCVGICQNRKIELVSAWDYAEAVEALETANARVAALEWALGKFVHVTPREGTWKEAYLGLQAQARKLLEPVASEGAVAEGKPV